MFVVLTIAAGKWSVCDITRRYNLWTIDTPLKNVTDKTICVITVFLLQNQIKIVKAKDRIVGIERWLKWCDESNSNKLLKKNKSIQERHLLNNTLGCFFHCCCRWNFILFYWICKMNIEKSVSKLSN